MHVPGQGQGCSQLQCTALQLPSVPFCTLPKAAAKHVLALSTC